MQTGYKVGDIMTNKPIAGQKDMSLREAAKLMADKDVNSLLIVEEEAAIGIITDEDIVREVVAKALDPKKLKLKDIMVTNLISIAPEKDIYDALMLMRDNNIRQLPVIKQKKLYGFLTIKDVLKIQPELFDLVVDKYDIREPRIEDDFDRIVKRKKK